MVVTLQMAEITAELMKTAGMNTLLGMGTVFIVLILIMALISCFKFIGNIGQKPAKEEPKQTSVDKAVEQIAANEEAQDDTELIAVISAAIAAFEGSNASGDGYVVRSIRRIR